MTIAALQQLISVWSDHLLALLQATSPAEWLAAVASPLLALLLCIRACRLIEAREGTSLTAHMLEKAAPLIAPFLATLFTGLALIALQDAGETPLILTLIFRLCVAWLATHSVITLSSGRTASLFIGLVIVPVTLLHLFGAWDMVEKVLQDASFTIGTSSFNLYQLLKGIICILALIWATNLFVGLVENRLRRIRAMRASSRTLILKFVQIGLYVMVFLMAMRLLGISLTTLSIFSGAIGVGIGFGLQKIASNFISGIILLFEKSIEVNDLLELSDGTFGFVRRTSARFTLLQAPDGRELMIPNEEFISQRVTSWTHSNHQGRVQIDVGVGYDDDIEKALQLMLKAVSATKRALKDPAPSAYMMGFGDSSINLSLYFWVDAVEEGRNEPRSQVMIAILKSFRANGINIPFPIRDVRMTDTTPKPKKA